MHRILIFSASVGAGHLRAAQAVELAARQLLPDATIRNVDILQLTNAAFRRVYGKAYLDLVNKTPHVLGYMYDLLDRPSKSGWRDRLRLAVEKLNLKQFTRLITEEPWELIINTHFLPAEIVASLKASGKLHIPQVTVTTDFETHRLWVNQPCERFFTATGEGTRYLHSMGVPSDATRVTGIPIHPAFSAPLPRAGCLQRHGLRGDRPILLQLAGGFGVGPIEKVHRCLLELPEPVELVVVTGRNEAIAAALKEVPCPPRHLRHVIGFTSEIHELMAVADIVVSKPGGLTTSEILASGAAMVIINPIPGQESRNSDFLLESGAAIKANNLATLAYKVGSLLSDPHRIRHCHPVARTAHLRRLAASPLRSSIILIS
jgi:processive 1,2-diacylglycerol beta-glucosyltransferase